MVIKAEQERVRELLREAIPMLCKTGLTYKKEFQIEALVGITLDDQCFIVSIKETFQSENYNPEQDNDSESGVSQEHGKKKRSRKRKRRRSGSSKGKSDSESDSEDDSRVKREKEGDESYGYGEGESESQDPIIIKDEPEDVNIKFETFPAANPHYPGQSFSQPLTQSFNVHSPFMSHSQPGLGPSGTSAAAFNPNGGSPWAGAGERTPDGQPGTNANIKEVISSDGKRMLMCLVCCKTYAAKDRIRAHVDLHFGRAKFKCDNCGKLLNHKGDHSRHVSSCTSKHNRSQTFMDYRY